MPTESRQCNAVKADGQRCRAQARPGSALCAFHDLAVEGRRREGRSRGGRTSCRKVAVLAADAPDFPLATPAEVRAALASLVNLTLKGKVDARIANAATYTAATLLRSVDADDFNRRLEALEATEAARRVKG